MRIIVTHPALVFLCRLVKMISTGHKPLGSSFVSPLLCSCAILKHYNGTCTGEFLVDCIKRVLFFLSFCTLKKCHIGLGIMWKPHKWILWVKMQNNERLDGFMLWSEPFNILCSSQKLPFHMDFVPAASPKAAQLLSLNVHSNITESLEMAKKL